MQHININPVKGKTTTTPTSTPAGSLTYPIVEEEFYADTETKYWYKKYSDGWIEQGGYVSPQTIAGYGSVDIVFPEGKEFVNAPIYIECQPYGTGDQGGDVSLYGVRNISSSGFTYTRGNSVSYTNTGFYWVAKGI